MISDIILVNKINFSFKYLDKLAFFKNFKHCKKTSIYFIYFQSALDLIKNFNKLHKDYNLVYVQIEFLFSNKFLNFFVLLFSKHFDNIYYKLQLMFLFNKNLFKKDD